MYNVEALNISCSMETSLAKIYTKHKQYVNDHKNCFFDWRISLISYVRSSTEIKSWAGLSNEKHNVPYVSVQKKLHMLPLG